MHKQHTDWRKHVLAKKYRSPTHYVLSSIIPYTEANIKLAFKPGLFFDDLDTLSAIKADRSALQSAYYRLKQRGMIKLDTGHTPRVTAHGARQLQLYEPTKLGPGASILLIFDIPETERVARNRLRRMLRELRFTQVQQSVWQTKYDVMDYLRCELDDRELSSYVRVFEALELP